MLQSITTNPELEAWRDAARARDAERREAVSKIYWLRIHRKALAVISVIYLLALSELNRGVAWGLFVLTLGAGAVALVIGAWASPRRPSL